MDIYIAAGLDHDLYNIYDSKNNDKKALRYYPHPEYDSVAKTRKYDIGLVEIDSNFEFNEETKIYPACLYFEKVKIFNDKLMLAGYGWSTEITKINTKRKLDHNNTDNFNNSIKPFRSYNPKPDFILKYNRSKLRMLEVEFLRSMIDPEEAIMTHSLRNNLFSSSCLGDRYYN